MTRMPSPESTLPHKLVVKEAPKPSFTDRLISHWDRLSPRGKVLEVGSAAVAAVTVGIALSTPHVEAKKPEFSFSKEIAADPTESVRISEGMTGYSLVQSIYDEQQSRIRDGKFTQVVPGPAHVDGLVLEQAADVVNEQGTYTGLDADGHKTYILPLGKSVNVPVITPEQAQHSAELLAGH